MIAMLITTTGNPVDSRPTESPVMIFVACPIYEELAIDCTGP